MDASWLTSNEAAPDLKAVLLSFDPVTRFSGSAREQLAAVLDCDEGLAESLNSHLTLSGSPFEALEELFRAASLAHRIGIGGSALKLVQSTVYANLAEASAAVQAAFRAKYDEAEWEAKVEPFRDALLSRRRDGLVAYLLHSAVPKFDDVSDLYHYFLLDVELEGCVRTSRVASAIDTVQLYVQRCLMNFEETPPGQADAVHVRPESIPDEEWAWRKNYRVWEANRKIFLYPENYLEPELRDDKTPLFEALEDELLSKEVTDETILEAYARYLRGFDELAHLTISGSYHEKDEDARRDVLHLFGVTNDEPPVFYYRRVENAHYGATSDDRASHWGPWEKLNIQVPVRNVSAIVHRGQLYVLWIRYVTKSQSKLKNGDSKFIGYQHRAFVEFSRRKLDGSWTTPQRLRLNENPFGHDSFPESYEDDGQILDPIVPKDSDSVEIPFFNTGITIYSNFQPLYDSRAHKTPKDDYTLKGFNWERLYPASGQELNIRGADFQLWSPVDLYRLKIGARYEYEDPDNYGVPWLNPGGLALIIFIVELSGGDFDLDDLMPSRLVWSRHNKTDNVRVLHSAPSNLPCFDTYSFATLLLYEERIKKYEQPLAATGPSEWTLPQWSEDITEYLSSMLTTHRLADVPVDASLDVVNGSVGDVIIQTSKDAFYLQSEVREDGKYHLRRLNTSVSEDIADLLFNRGLEELLATKTQLDLQEHDVPFTLVNSRVKDATTPGKMDFKGPMGTYLREIFFHIPFIIANHLNSQGRFEDAQRWYHFIFDPTASETIQGLPANLSDEERHRRELDRNWRYCEFRGLTLDSMRDQLTDEAAIDQYKRDPFNPHAIARLRISAYQKAIVMKYVDNLLDWGDHLFAQAFAQLNPECLREATLKYVTAQEILGVRPAKLGDCGEGKLTPKTFPNIQEEIENDSEFLMEMESLVFARYLHAAYSNAEDDAIDVNAERGRWVTKSLYAGAARKGDAATVPDPISRPTPAKIGAMFAAAPAEAKEAAARMTAADMFAIGRGAPGGGISVDLLFGSFLIPELKWIPPWGQSFV